MKVLQTTADEKETSTEIEIKAKGLSKSAAREAKQQIGEFLVEQVLLSVNDKRSPVAGESWPALSKAYKQKKKDDGYTPEANLLAKGDLLDALTFKVTDKGIKVGFFGSQAPKADGHLKFSGKDNNTPQRRFLPAEDQEFKTSISNEVDKILADSVAENATVSAKDLEAVETKAQLYELLSGIFAGLTRTEIKQAVYRSEDLFEMLDEYELLELL